ncbi:MAG: MarR family transcriptional regulator [Porphyrobacter sp.]|nr:MarR family transcriptional regulator [Porphyrobacter sp.]
MQARPGLGANDGPADDFLALAEQLQGDDGQPLLDRRVPASPQLTLDGIAANFSAGQMRQLGSTLLKLADALDDGWNPDELRATYHWLTQAGRIERQALKLAQVAMRMRSSARRRCRHLSGEWFGEPAWEMLLELFIQFAGGARVSTKSLVIASGASDTTALRVIDRLEDAGLVERAPSQTDKRVTLLSLTRDGVVAVGMVLMESEA